MERVILITGICFCLFALWAVLRHDWHRIGQPSRRVTARVIGYRAHHDSDGKGFAAVYRFSAEGREFEVIDQLYSARRDPPEGTAVELSYPYGRPDLARPPRLAMWLAVYGLLIGLTGLLAAKLAGLIGG